MYSQTWAIRTKQTGDMQHERLRSLHRVRALAVRDAAAAYASGLIYIQSLPEEITDGPRLPK